MPASIQRLGERLFLASLRRVDADQFPIVAGVDPAAGERRMAPHHLTAEALVRRVEEVHPAEFLVLLRGQPGQDQVARLAEQPGAGRGRRIVGRPLRLPHQEGRAVLAATVARRRGRGRGRSPQILAAAGPGVHVPGGAALGRRD